MITNSNDQKSPSCSMFTYLPPIDPCLVQKYNLSYHLYILSVSTNIKPDLCVLEPLYKTIDVRDSGSSFSQKKLFTIPSTIGSCCHSVSQPGMLAVASFTIFTRVTYQEDE